MQNLKTTNQLLIVMCLLSVMSIILLFTSRITEEKVIQISSEVTMTILQDMEFMIVE